MKYACKTTSTVRRAGHSPQEFSEAINLVSRWIADSEDCWLCHLENKMPLGRSLVLCLIFLINSAAVKSGKYCCCRGISNRLLLTHYILFTERRLCPEGQTCVARCPEIDELKNTPVFSRGALVEELIEVILFFLILFRPQSKS